ncbi:protein kinase C zeta type-like isoform X1 [Sinocyclocheilus rhinocerous]|uniref:protein kinase C zeta type-like isoform X1 n=1 Tax=Sinocyclocheilus rhinocerous TaxID=307959 RepID=UPI0007B9A9D9|nr:PREDICTED: protein kinase C zeta type-like isoform X1 [Sinocyclocheilus rhinocerous]
MPVSNGSVMDLPSEYVKVKAHYGGDMLISDLDLAMTYTEVCEEVRTMCGVRKEIPITLKWIDDEGDPCTISSQMELEEAFRIYNRNGRSGLLLHVFPSIPEKPGMPCPGEDKSIYRRGARRWRKLYRVNGHLFQAKRFNRKAYCGHCSERIWGLGRQGYKCINCKLLVHKRCHKLVPLTCQRHMDPVMPSQEPLVDDNKSGEEVEPPPEDPEETDAIPVSFLAHNRKVEKAEDDAEDLKAVVDGIEGIQISQGLGLGDFDLIRVIGRGSYAKVLLVRLKKNEQIYAMKVVKKELVHDDEKKRKDIDWVQTEKHVFEQASTNPFLVGLHSCFQTESRLFLVIEYVNGGDLMFHMQKQRKLPEEHARFYAAEICIALNFLHEKGIIYRDLKLDNVLLDQDGHIKITDYGMCKEGIRPGDTTSTFCGTPNYIAPEILRGEDYGFSVDWWALGVLMFEMMAGRSPFDIITDNPDMNTEEYLFQVILEKPIRIPRSLSVKAASVLKGFLNKDPKERLGCQVQTGFTDIKSHTFFRSIDWDQLEQKQVTPPFKPQITDDYGLDNFDTQFTNEPVQLTPDDEDVLKRIDQSEFEGFDYINPLLLSNEETV